MQSEVYIIKTVSSVIKSYENKFKKLEKNLQELNNYSIYLWSDQKFTETVPIAKSYQDYSFLNKSDRLSKDILIFANAIRSLLLSKKDILLKNNICLLFRLESEEFVNYWLWPYIYFDNQIISFSMTEKDYFIRNYFELLIEKVWLLKDNFKIKILFDDYNLITDVYLDVCFP